MTIFFALLFAVGIALLIVLQLPAFGRAPRGKRLERIKQSPHYHNGRFHNLRNAPTLTSSKSLVQRIKEFIFERPRRLKPSAPLPFVHTPLSTLAQANDDVLVWLGHSSVFLKTDGLTFLVDPVFTTASPFPWLFSPFKGSNGFTIEEVPPRTFPSSWQHALGIFPPRKSFSQDLSFGRWRLRRPFQKGTPTFWQYWLGTYRKWTIQWRLGFYPYDARTSGASHWRLEATSRACCAQQQVCTSSPRLGWTAAPTLFRSPAQKFTFTHPTHRRSGTSQQHSTNLWTMVDFRERITPTFSYYCCSIKVFLVIKTRMKPSCRISAYFVTLQIAKN